MKQKFLLMLHEEGIEVITKALDKLAEDTPDDAEAVLAVDTRVQVDKMMKYQQQLDAKLAEDSGNTADLPEVEI